MSAMFTSSARMKAARIAAPIGAAAALLSTLTGCSTAATEAGAPAADAPVTAPVNANYTDGTFEADGAYQSPNGSENITVIVSLKDNIVTDVEVVTNPTNPTTASYQGQFSDGIGALVVGEDIDALDVTVVAGSSLTSQGFREALTVIKADALES
jgi:uncharacterized protein with FMN-binding domain